jgi:hypothetical protein
MTEQNYTIRDSGERVAFQSGAVRDTQDGKPRYELLPPGPLRRVALHYANGAKKYADNNWAQGMPTSRFLASLMRHIEQYREGDTVEDHLAAVVFNAFGIMYFQGTEFDDLYPWGVNPNSSVVEESIKSADIDTPRTISSILPCAQSWPENDYPS